MFVGVFKFKVYQVYHYHLPYQMEFFLSIGLWSADKKIPKTQGGNRTNCGLIVTCVYMLC